MRSQLDDCACSLTAIGPYSGRLETDLLALRRDDRLPFLPRRLLLYRIATVRPQPKSDAVAKPPAADSDVDTIPDSFDQAAGLERAEIDYPDIFAHNDVSRGPFGTESNPALIESAFDERIVGCTGQAAPADHDLHWLTVKKGELCTCPVCGQVFALSPL